MWTEARIRDEISCYSSRKELYKKNQYVYRKALNLGILDDFQFPEEPNKWTEDALFAEARKYSSKSQFLKNNRYAVLAAKRLGIYNQVCAHMNMSKASVNYLLFFGGDLYKTGVSSEHAFEARVEKIERASGLKVLDTLTVNHHKRPREIETLILYIGKPIDFDRTFDGSGEFRKFTEMEKQLAISILMRS